MPEWVKSIPKQYLAAKLDDHEYGPVLLEWLDDPEGGLITLTGPPGTGKTHMLYAVMKRLRHNNRPYQLLTAPEFCQNARMYAMADGQERYWTKHLREQQGHILLDDLGAEKTTDFVLQELYMLISYRELWDKPLLITTNLSLDDIAKKLDDRIASRLAGGQVLEFTGTDKRLQRAKA